ncbi:manganese efflux pump [Extibacter muris]|uniref:manganese efflux pump n=1 Tax=Extibacter muris TaxID=1796622 RepID=UPI001D08FBD6|nr:manganese efflux pump [Extibacter muris]MCB6202445.1 manganese efflux pump [Extibacter muris]MCQ4664930.1 manganese efflux pump [Extibacter muris]MCQ4694295.1 manganese efflux pump [Extibacter muris]
MHLISSILFALSANIDTLIVGISYGIKKERVPFAENIVISLITFAGTIFSIYMGLQLTLFIPASAAQKIGCIVLIILGLYYTVKSIIEYRQGKLPPDDWDNPEAEPPDKTISLKEAILIACALTVNNMGMGIGASISGMKLIPTSIATLLICMVFLHAGNKIGRIGVSGALKRWAGPVSGMILIVLGLYEMLLS